MAILSKGEDFFSLKVDKNLPIPLYKQIVNMIEELIENGDLKAHDKLPSEASLSKILGVSRMTVRKAFEELERQGLLYRRSSKGTFVAPRKILQNPSLLIGFAKKMQAQGYQPVTTLISKRIIYPLAHIQKHLNVAPGDLVYEIVRLRGIKGDEYLALQKAYIPAALFPDLLSKDVSDSLTDIIRSYGYEISGYWVSIEATMPNEEEMRLLRMDTKKPLLMIKGVTKSIEGTPLRYSVGLFRTDKLKIVVEEHVVDFKLKSK